MATLMEASSFANFATSSLEVCIVGSTSNTSSCFIVFVITSDDLTSTTPSAVTPSLEPLDMFDKCTANRTESVISNEALNAVDICLQSVANDPSKIHKT